MKVSLFFVYMLVILIVNISLSCFPKESKNTLAYVFHRKWSDPGFIQQSKFLADCLDSIPEELYSKRDRYMDFHANTICKYITKNFKSDEEIKKFKSKSFIDCVLMVSKHEANKYLCKTEFLTDDGFDFIEKYVILEYNECIKLKNKDDENPLIFKLPKLAFSTMHTSGSRDTFQQDK
ncbi:hypothetical protein BDAP_002857 [Binucleata daphniae]